jgi:hypothetical protein
MENLTEAQQSLIPDLLKLQKLASELNIKIEAVSTYRIRNGQFEPDFKVELLGTDCYSSPLLYQLETSHEQ